MKKITILSIAVLALTLFSFKKFEGNRVTLLKDGNYYVPQGIVQEGDARILADLTTFSKGTTTVVHTTVWKHVDAVAKETTIVHTTVYKHEDSRALQTSASKEKYQKVQEIMAKYLK